MTEITITIAASAPMPGASQIEEPSGWAAYGRSGQHHSVLAEGRDTRGGTAHRMYLTALLHAMNKLKWGCDITVACNDINIVRGININLDRFRQHQFRAKQKNTDLWRQIVALESERGHNLTAAYIPASSDADLTTAQDRARTVRNDPPPDSSGPVASPLPNRTAWCEPTLDM